MKNAASQYVQSVVTDLQSIATLDNRVYPVLTDDEMTALSQVNTFPAIGVEYDGIIRLERQGQGLACELSINIIIFYQMEAVLGQIVASDYKAKALDLFDEIRQNMLRLKTPEGKNWSFMAELPALQKGTLTMWVQRWKAPVILT